MHAHLSRACRPAVHSAGHCGRPRPATVTGCSCQGAPSCAGAERAHSHHAARRVRPCPAMQGCPWRGGPLTAVQTRLQKYARHTELLLAGGAEGGAACRRRYAGKVAALRSVFSEFGLIRCRVLVEVRRKQERPAPCSPLCAPVGVGREERARRLVVQQRPYRLCMTHDLPGVPARRCAGCSSWPRCPACRRCQSSAPARTRCSTAWPPTLAWLTRWR